MSNNGICALRGCLNRPRGPEYRYCHIHTAPPLLGDETDCARGECEKMAEPGNAWCAEHCPRDEVALPFPQRQGERFRVIATEYPLEAVMPGRGKRFHLMPGEWCEFEAREVRAAASPFDPTTVIGVVWNLEQRGSESVAQKSDDFLERLRQKVAARFG